MEIQNSREEKVKILTLEDDENWWAIFKYIFDKRFYELQPTKRIEEAKKFLNAKQFDIVIINIKLFPKFKLDKSGIILLEYIQAKYSWLPRIVVSAEELDKDELIKSYDLRDVVGKTSLQEDASNLLRAVHNATNGGFMEEYTDFYLHIGPDGHIRSSSNEGNQTDKISVDVPDDIQEILNKIEKNETDGKSLKFFGKKLYDIIFQPKIHTHFSQTEAVARENKQKIRIRLTIEPDTLAALPLEFAYREQGGYFLSANPKTVLSHYLDLPLPQNRIRRRKDPLDMLIIIANPEDQYPLNPDEWEKIITTALYKPLKAKKIKIRTIKRATRREISKALLKQQPDIVQFVGHGIYRSGKGYLALVDEKTGKTWELDDERFASLFLGSDDHLGLVSLATCESAKTDSPKGFLGIAPKIVQRGVPAVVAMRYRVLISTAEIFLEEFYNALAENKPVDWAIQWARNQVSLDKGIDNREFATPVLFMRAKDGNIF